jgi:hypothetical protein
MLTIVCVNLGGYFFNIGLMDVWLATIQNG